MTDAANWTDRHAAAAMAWDITPNQFVVAACRKLRPGRALDLGAGDGSNSVWLAGRGWQVTAIDTDTIRVGRIQSHSALLGRPVDAVVGDAVSYRPPAATFDLVLLSYLQLPDHQLRQVLGHVAPALAPGGRILIVGHDSSNLDGGWGGPQDPDLLTTAEHLSGLLEGLGLDVQRAQVVRREVLGEVGIHIALDHIVEALRTGPTAA
ncbi:MAG: class I SAM-dependent methyltransferase [Propionibacteriaceae bacterium]|nr:class I SAM-dependent methyltransferase [Propionibacteriaceae bacterium]